MKTHQLHPWSLTAEQARSIQRNLANWIVTADDPREPKLVARIQLHPSPKEEIGSESATVTLYALPSMEVIGRKHAIKNTQFLRIEGMLCFRKSLAAIAALEKLPQEPDLLICDGRCRLGRQADHRRSAVDDHPHRFSANHNVHIK